MLDTLVYESRAAEALTDTELEVVLIGSRVRNARRGVTGVLLKRDRHILQLLEGPSEAVERTFAAIAASPLHGDVAVLARGPAPTRVFDTWHMGFCDFQALHVRSLSTDAWLDVMPAVRARAGGHPAVGALLARWSELTDGDAGPA